MVGGGGGREEEQEEVGGCGVGVRGSWCLDFGT